MNNQSSEKLVEKIRISPPADWVNVRPFDASFAPKELGHLTVLLSDSQYHAEHRRHYWRVVQRLETMQAVQNASQHKLDFDPNTQEVVIHSISVIRGDRRVEQASIDRFHFLQREDALESFVLHGWATLLLLLEDVCVGDVIDASYTITTAPRLLRERFCVFHGMPLGVQVKALHVDVCFAKSRLMQWRSSAKDLAPQVSERGDEIRWEWKRENLMDAIPEPNLPNWFLAGTWIQVTDCQSWEDVVGACVSSWPLESENAEVQQLAESLRAGTQNDEERIEKAINYVQDGFRYLSVDLAFGGQIPSPARDVLRRRFGDCKDLSCLMALLLRSLGIPARPVLVNTMLTKKVRDLLPMPAVFNHVITEYDLGSERRWVDATRRLQGGGARSHSVSDFGFGLAVQAGTKELHAMPQQSRYDGDYKLKEAFWLNSAGSLSILEVTVTATGAEADVLRNHFANAPEGLIAEQREQFYAEIFPKVKRLGRIARRDNRVKNEFTLAEMYEITGALRLSAYGDACFFPYESHLVQRVFRQPLHDARKHPCALPYPYNIEHTIEIDFPSLQIWPLPQYAKTHALFRLGRKTRFAQGFHTITFSLQTLSDSILPEHFKEFRTVADEVWPETAMFVPLPLGVRGRRPKYSEAKL